MLNGSVSNIDTDEFFHKIIYINKRISIEYTYKIGKRSLCSTNIPNLSSAWIKNDGNL